jgi:hypothetical protein
MKSTGLIKHVTIAFIAALVLYAISYTWIEHRRNRAGPWEATFTRDSAGNPTLIINQPSLAITNLQISFANEPAPATNFPQTIRFDQPQKVPFDVPLGKCIFMDTTFLPGTIVFSMYGHEIQLILRVLTVDGKEIAWQSNTNIVLAAPVSRQP